MKAKVYLETSVISYITARLSTNLIVAAHQQLTATSLCVRQGETDMMS